MNLRTKRNSIHLGAMMALAGLLVSAYGQEILLRMSEVLTNAAQVRALKPDEALQQLPVRLRGVVLLEGTDQLTLMDQTAGIFIVASSEMFANFRRCDLLEVGGVSEPGNFAPVVRVTNVWKVGKAALPDPIVASFEELQTGRLDSQWVEVRGVVRRLRPRSQPEGIWELWLATGGGQVRVMMSKEQAAMAAPGTELSLRGLVFYRFNNARQALYPVLTLSREEAVVVLTPAPAEPYAVPPKSVASLMQFSVEESHRQRVHVRGVVTHAYPGHEFWIRDEKQGLEVSTWQTNSLERGTVLDILGFVSRGRYSPVLEDAVFRQVSVGPPPLPTHLTNPAQAMERDADLVELEATIQEQRLALDGCRLTLLEGTNRFTALLRMSANQPAPPEWRAGSRARITGICSVNASKAGVTTGMMEPQSFDILLRSAADLEILQPPPWWSPEHLSWVLGLALGLLLLVVAGIIWNARGRLLRLSLARRTSEAEFAAVLNERNRLARELHDTLAQGLGAISMHLEVAKRALPVDSEARVSLNEAHTLARSNLADARDSIWNMRSQVLETGDLAKALGDILKSLTSGTGTHGELHVRGRVRRLAPVKENNLLRIGQEAITNAAKHAAAKRIEVVLEYEQHQVQLSVLDDGRGFDPEHTPKSKGGFGLVGMRERTAELHGELTITSVAGEGCAVALKLPLPAGVGDVVT